MPVLARKARLYLSGLLHVDVRLHVLPSCLLKQIVRVKRFSCIAYIGQYCSNGI